MTDHGSPLRIIYDGECPVCSRYVTYLRIKESVGPVTLLDARAHPDVALELTQQGLDLDEGMVAEYGGRTYHGADCVNFLALLSSDVGWFNRINGAIFRRAWLARIVYPVLRLGRNTLLRILGRSKIGQPVATGSGPSPSNRSES